MSSPSTPARPVVAELTPYDVILRRLDGMQAQINGLTPRRTTPKVQQTLVGKNVAAIINHNLVVGLITDEGKQGWLELQEQGTTDTTSVRYTSVIFAESTVNEVNRLLKRMREDDADAPGAAEPSM